MQLPFGFLVQICKKIPCGRTWTSGASWADAWAASKERLERLYKSLLNCHSLLTYTAFASLNPYDKLGLQRLVGPSQRLSLVGSCAEEGSNEGIMTVIDHFKHESRSVSSRSLCMTQVLHDNFVPVPWYSSTKDSCEPGASAISKLTPAEGTSLPLPVWYFHLVQ